MRTRRRERRRRRALRDTVVDALLAAGVLAGLAAAIALGPVEPAGEEAAAKTERAEASDGGDAWLDERLRAISEGDGQD